MEKVGLLELGTLANNVRQKNNPDNAITFVIDSNPNYTNICQTECLFCSFYRKPGAEGAYGLTLQELKTRVAFAFAKGATTMLLQGGNNPALPLDYYLNVVRMIANDFSGLTPHCFSVPEIITMAQASGVTVKDVLQRLKEAGQHTLPGGGAEILTERVRCRISPKKPKAEEWLNVHREAHLLGFISTATMMYGHVETPEDIVEHWDKIRALQDETRGFTAFVPWSFKPYGSALEGKTALLNAPTPQMYLRIIAASRLYLDNFKHIQASWFSEGKKTGQVALHFGADDFGGILLEEHVHESANFINKADTAEVINLIREAGFAPVQRTTRYELLTNF